MASKSSFLVFGLLLILATLLLVTTARELAEKTDSKDQVNPEDRGHGGGGYGYPGHGGGYPGHGGGGGGYPGHGGGGGYCRWGCCRRGYYGGCRCCSFPGEVPDAEYKVKPGN
ncbi:glycine-rich cell wall structural protein-like [Zingiber officinale]|uniref:Glycine-rich protein n=1 Tax=Zingiber officinale TaxID=94328 RepID=A0A8J5CVY0_ZINOF|nr:glycine-rich cell wall structural protein-like [Zingiber officinale]KAG6472031.1 hypothetical protein ZIOFF_069486 [Zingiber officinale]